MADVGGLYVMACQTAPGSGGDCPNPVWMHYADITAFQISQLDPSTLASAFAAGFVIPATFYVIGRVAGVVLSMIDH
ncbi:hypothetical protein [Salinisphaera hydrothermalis]|uniref:hypothetical protein n=1 Tax=Salinisphaera hydrothermalis TaxID=563188 RepID=UPI00333E59AA